uniref:Uncharacterized protein n=1 Tax=Aegilops tauschii subsp. strangulata TaxID=200361 RepID=A0A453SZE2_AEGTS
VIPPDQCLPYPSFTRLGAATMAADPQCPRPLDHGQRPDVGVPGTGTVCCSAPRSFHVSPAHPVSRRFFHSGLGKPLCSALCHAHASVRRLLSRSESYSSHVKF